jgi:hypothetical protein
MDLLDLTPIGIFCVIFRVDVFFHEMISMRKPTMSRQTSALNSKSVLSCSPQTLCSILQGPDVGVPHML